jgi:hypothetical protein
MTDKLAQALVTIAAIEKALKFFDGDDANAIELIKHELQTFRDPMPEHPDRLPYDGLYGGFPRQVRDLQRLVDDGAVLIIDGNQEGRRAESRLWKEGGRYYVQLGRPPMKREESDFFYAVMAFKNGQSDTKPDIRIEYPVIGDVAS